MTSNVLIESDGKQYLSLPDFDRDGMVHFFTTKKPSLNSPHLFKGGQGGVIFSDLILVKQVHGDDILIIDKPVDDVKKLKGDASGKQCDAIITNQKNIGIGVVSADCLPALLYDPVQSVIAAVHAGWRGTLKGVMSKVVSQMVDMFDCRPEDIVAGIGPVIGPCCYVVGDIVARPLKESNPEWESFLKPIENSKSILDLTGLNSFQIEEAGVLKKNIFFLGQCTSCNKELFPSYRRDGIGTGRIISGIVMD